MMEEEMEARKKRHWCSLCDHGADLDDGTTEHMACLLDVSLRRSGGTAGQGLRFGGEVKVIPIDATAESMECDEWWWSS